MTAAVLLTGAPGAGKSSVLEKLATLFEIDGVDFGALETEQLGWGSPWLSGDQWLAQVRAVFELQRAAGRRLFLIAATAETSDDLSRLIDAIAVDHVTTVLLVAPANVVAARIEAREPDSWPGKSALIKHARDLASSMQELDNIDIQISTENRQSTEVAIELRAKLRDRGIRPTV
jgi:gluconate kinase